jgi:LPXTG-motif cell wall-anchored protein
MRLAHLGLTVTDQERSRRFYETHFRFDAASARSYPDGTLIIRDPDGFALALHPGPATPDDEFLHFGYVCADPDEVREMRARLRAGGVPLVEDEDAASYVGIKGGAKADTDGWTFDQPVKDAHVVAYAFVFVNGDQPEVLGIGPDGVFAIDPGAGSESSLEQKLGAAARSGKIASAAVPTVPLPAGVKGGLIDNNGGAWLQTPKGWRLLFGVLATDVTEPAVDKFDLKGVCLPAGAEPQPSASPSPSTGGQGGGSGGDTLPLTGANVGVLAGAGVLLVAVGVALFLIRRRRNSVKFVA